MAAAQELLVHGSWQLRQLAAVSLADDQKPWWSFFAWPRRGLVAIEAVDALRGVLAHLVLVDDGVLCAGWHSAHLPVAEPVRPRLIGFAARRSLSTRNAARIRANAITTATKTERKDMHPPQECVRLIPKTSSRIVI